MDHINFKTLPHFIAKQQSGDVCAYLCTNIPNYKWDDPKKYLGIDVSLYGDEKISAKLIDYCSSFEEAEKKIELIKASETSQEHEKSCKEKFAEFETMNQKLRKEINELKKIIQETNNRITDICSGFNNDKNTLEMVSYIFFCLISH